MNLTSTVVRNKNQTIGKVKIIREDKVKPIINGVKVLYKSNFIGNSSMTYTSRLLSAIMDHPMTFAIQKFLFPVLII